MNPVCHIRPKPLFSLLHRTNGRGCVLASSQFPVRYYAVWQDLEASHGRFFPRGSHVLMVTVVQEDSRRVESQPHAATQAEIIATLRSMYGRLGPVPEPLAMLVPVWWNNPAFHGCWSNLAINATAQDFASMQEPLGSGSRLFFAGEATDGDFNGFVLGGYSSGERAAKLVLGELRGGRE